MVEFGIWFVVVFVVMQCLIRYGRRLQAEKAAKSDREAPRVDSETTGG